MHDERSCPCPDTGVLSPAEKDANAERGVLTLVLCDYPEVYTSEELVRSVVFDVEDFMECDAVARAIRSLLDLALLHSCGPLIFPSRAALRMHVLEQEEGGR